MSKLVEFSELLATKLCHDLAGQINAVDNGVEFLKTGNNDVKEKALELLAESSADLVAKLKLYRFAYGVNKSDGEADLELILQTLLAFFAKSKITINWELYHPDHNAHNLTNQAAQLLLNMILIISSSMIYGGNIKVEITRENQHKNILVTGMGESIRTSKDAEIIIKNKELMDAKLSNIQIYFTVKLANSLGADLDLIEEQGKLILKAEFANHFEPWMN
jgi:histidine phosphotransferase ChpT